MDATDRVVRFGDENSLVGILTEPAENGRAGSAPTVIVLNAGTLHRIGPHRLYVKIARRLGAAGFSVLRFDFSGVGDSLRRHDNVPLEAGALLEVQDAMHFLGAETGARRFILMGLCGGGHFAFRMARHDARVVGAAMVDWFAYRTWGWYRRFLLGDGGLWEGVSSLLTSMKRPHGAIWNNGALLPRAQAEADLRALLRRDVALFFVYTGAQRSYYNYREQLQDAFHTLPLAGKVEVHFYRDADHTLTLLHHQHRLTDAIHDWVERVARGLTRGPEPAPRDVVATPAWEGAGP